MWRGVVFSPVKFIIAVEGDEDVPGWSVDAGVGQAEDEPEDGPEPEDLSAQLQRLLRVGGDGGGLGLEGGHVGPCRVQPQLVEVVLEHAVHQSAVLALPQGLVHEQLRLLGHVELHVLAGEGGGGRLQVIKVCRSLQDLHVESSPDGDNHQGVLLPPEPAELHGRHGVVHPEAVHHVLVVVDEDVVGGESHGHQEEASAGDVHLLNAGDGAGLLHRPQLAALVVDGQQVVVHRGHSDALLSPDQP